MNLSRKFSVFLYKTFNIRTAYTTSLICYEELIKSLIALSSNAEKQKEIIGYGQVAQELVEDFYHYYSNCREQYLMENLITKEQDLNLGLLEKLFKEQKDQSFWDDDNLGTNIQWQEVRKIASENLKILGKSDFTIEVKRTHNNTMSPEGKSLTIENTKIILVKKKST